jgi:hypothetical protein
MPKRPVFKLSVLGTVPDGGAASLTTLAHFQASQATEKIKLQAKPLRELIARIRQLRGFITVGDPKWDRKTLQSLGEELFDLIFKGNVRDLFNQASGQKKVLLPLEITVQDPMVATWPWEFMFDPFQSKYLCQEFRPVCRSIMNLPPGPSPKQPSLPIHVLLVVGAKPGDPRTRPEEYVKQFKNIFETHLGNDCVRLRIVSDRDIAGVNAELNAGPLDILHFYGHAGFDSASEEGYLKLERTNGGATSYLKATQFAQMLALKKVRLAFLNACETGVASETEVAARSSVAASLLAHGIPAIIATQYTMPVNSASAFSSLAYTQMAMGKTLSESVREARMALSFDGKALFCDWGIPAVYTIDPGLVVFPRKAGQRRPALAQKLSDALGSKQALANLASLNEQEGAPGLSVFSTLPRAGQLKPKVKVALVDIDSGVGFLPELAERANAAQDYYHFRVSYPPVPTATIAAGYNKKTGVVTPAKFDLKHGAIVEGKLVQITWAPRLDEILAGLPKTLKVDMACCLTANMIGDGKEYDLFTCPLKANSKVMLISTFDARRYAEKAGVSFEMAVLFLCLGQLLSSDPKLDLSFHDETAGCLMDYCDDRDDVVVGLKHMKFDHTPCRDDVSDKKQLAAIDALLALEKPGRKKKE